MAKLGLSSRTKGAKMRREAAASSVGSANVEKLHEPSSSLRWPSSVGLVRVRVRVRVSSSSLTLTLALTLTLTLSLTLSLTLTLTLTGW